MAESSTHLVPSDRLDSIRIQIWDPERYFAPPGFFGVFIDLGIKAVNEGIRKCGPCRRGQFQRVRQQVSCVLSHVFVLQCSGTPHAGSRVCDTKVNMLRIPRKSAEIRP